MAVNDLQTISVGLTLDVEKLLASAQKAKTRLNELIPPEQHRTLVLTARVDEPKAGQITAVATSLETRLNAQLKKALKIDPKFTVTRGSAVDLRKQIERELNQVGGKVSGGGVRVPLQPAKIDKGFSDTLQNSINQKVKVSVPLNWHWRAKDLGAELQASVAGLKITIPFEWEAAGPPPTPPNSGGTGGGRPSGGGTPSGTTGGGAAGGGASTGGTTGGSTGKTSTKSSASKTAAKSKPAAATAPVTPPATETPVSTTMASPKPVRSRPTSVDSAAQVAAVPEAPIHGPIRNVFEGRGRNPTPTVTNKLQARRIGIEKGVLTNRPLPTPTPFTKLEIDQMNAAAAAAGEREQLIFSALKNVPYDDGEPNLWRLRSASAEAFGEDTADAVVNAYRLKLTGATTEEYFAAGNAARDTFIHGKSGKPVNKAGRKLAKASSGRRRSSGRKDPETGEIIAPHADADLQALLTILGAVRSEGYASAIPDIDAQEKEHRQRMAYDRAERPKKKKIIERRIRGQLPYEDQFASVMEEAEEEAERRAREEAERRASGGPVEDFSRLTKLKRRAWDRSGRRWDRSTALLDQGFGPETPQRQASDRLGVQADALLERISGAANAQGAIVEDLIRTGQFVPPWSRRGRESRAMGGPVQGGLLERLLKSTVDKSGQIKPGMEKQSQALNKLLEKKRGGWERRAGGGPVDFNDKWTTVYRGGDIRPTNFLRKVSAYDANAAFVTPDREVAANYAVGKPGDVPDDPTRFTRFDPRPLRGLEFGAGTDAQYKLRGARQYARGMIHEGRIPLARIADARATRHLLVDTLGSSQQFAAASRDRLKSALESPLFRRLLDAGGYKAYTRSLGGGYLDPDAKEPPPNPYGIRFGPGARRTDSEIVVIDPRHLVNRLAGPKGILPRAAGGPADKFKITYRDVPNPQVGTFTRVFEALIGKEVAGSVEVYHDSYGEPIDIYPQVKPWAQHRGIATKLYEHIAKQGIPIEEMSNENAARGGQTQAGSAFWRSRKRKQGWTDEQINDHLYGWMDSNSDRFEGNEPLEGGKPLELSTEGPWGTAFPMGTRGRKALGGQTTSGLYRVGELGLEFFRSRSGRNDQWLGVNGEELWAAPEDGYVVPRHQIPPEVRHAFPGRMAGGKVDPDAFVSPGTGFPYDTLLHAPYKSPDFMPGGLSSFFQMNRGTPPNVPTSKVHVAATVAEAQDVLKIVDAVAKEMKVAYKWVKSTTMLRPGEPFGPGGYQEGKFITAYPKPDVARSFVEKVDVALRAKGIGKGTVNPRERRYAPDSPITHRYSSDVYGRNRAADDAERAATDGGYGLEGATDFVGTRKEAKNWPAGLAFHGRKGQRIDPSDAKTQGWVKGFGEIMRVFVVNWPAAGDFTAVRGRVPRVQAAQPKRVLTDEEEAADTEEKGSMGGGGGGGRGGNKRTAEDKARDYELKQGIAAAFENRMIGVRSSISESLQLVPVRALSVSIGQIMQTQFGGRAEILKRAKIAEKDVARAQQDTAELNRRSQDVRDIERDLERSDLEPDVREKRTNDLAQARQLVETQYERTGLSAARAEILGTVGGINQARKDLVKELGGNTESPEFRERSRQLDLAAADLDKDVKPGGRRPSEGALTRREQFRTQAVGLGGIVAGTMLFTTAMHAAQLGMGLLNEAVDRGVDAMRGFALTASRVTEDLAKAVMQQPGFPEVGVGQRLARLGVTPEMAGRFQPAADQAVLLAGAQQMQQLTDIRRAADFFAQSGGKQVRGLGADFANGIFGTFIHQTPSIGEQMVGELQRTSGKKGQGNFAFEGLVPALGLLNGISEAANNFELIPGVRTNFPVPFPTPKADPEGQRNLIADFNQFAARGNRGGGPQLKMSGDKLLVDATISSFEEAGRGDLGRMLTDMGYVLPGTGAGGEATAFDVNQYLGGYARGSLMGSPEQMWNTIQRPLRMQQTANIMQGQFQREQLLPFQFAMQQRANPFMQPGVGLVGAGAGAATAEIAASQARQRALAAPGEAKIQELMIEGGLDPAVFADLDRLGKRINDLRQEDIEIQVDFRERQFGEQQRLAVRQAGDLLGITGQQEATVRGINIQATQYGKLQRAQIMDQRLITELELKRSRRQMEFSLAVAKLNIPGETPGERFLNLQNIEAQAATERQIMDANERMNTRGITIEDISLGRNADDFLKDNGQLDQMLEGHTIQLKLEGDQAITTALDAERVQVQAIADTWLGPVLTNMQLTRDEQVRISLESGTWLGNLQNSATEAERILAAYEKIGLTPRGGFSGGVSSSGGWDDGGGGGGGGGAGGGFASGGLFHTKGRMRMTVGEAGSEMVAVIANPRQMEMGATSYAQPSAASLTINFNGPLNVRDDEDLNRIARKVDQLLNRRALAVGIGA